MSHLVRRSLAASAVLLVGALAPLTLPAAPAAAAVPGCRVDYAVTDFHNGFVVNITITNDGPATNGWQLDFTFPDPTQRLTSAFSARWTQNGQAVTALAAPWNARLPTGRSAFIGFQGSVDGPDRVPTDVRITGCGDQPFPPTPLVTGPQDNSTMLEGQVTVLRADTLGFPGTVTSVDFAVNGVLLGTATTTPFSLVWFPLPVGTFAITATAHDTLGTVATSAPLHLTVKPQPTTAATGAAGAHGAPSAGQKSPDPTAVEYP
jgi:hypothetical protein